MNPQKNFTSGFVALVGRPNVGKSTLMNRLVGQKVAIMSDKPQTTRHKIHAVLTLPDAQVVFLDTPGIHKPKHRLGEHMVETALGALREVDIVFFLVEAERPGAGDEFVIEKLKGIGTPVFLIINKIDLVKREELLPLMEEFRRKYEFAEIIPLSALSGDNVTGLVDIIKKYLPEGPRYYPDDMITDRPEQFVMAELIREKVLHLTSQEVPHSVTVVVEQVEETRPDLVKVSAIIYTERESQKGILIGKGGAMLKKVGELARREMETLLGSRIFLELWVKVRSDWRNNPGVLKNFGYIDRG